jgi:hypothetical protein
MDGGRDVSRGQQRRWHKAGGKFGVYVVCNTNSAATKDDRLTTESDESKEKKGEEERSGWGTKGLEMGEPGTAWSS